MPRPESRDLIFRDPEDRPTRWWCDLCRTYVDAWHPCPLDERPQP